MAMTMYKIEIKSGYWTVDGIKWSNLNKTEKKALIKYLKKRKS